MGDEAGFSLVEWIISILVLAMLAFGAFLLFQLITSTSERSEAKASMEEYATAVSDELRAIGWSECHMGQGGLYNHFRDNLAARMNPALGPNAIAKPASTQDPDGVGTWTVQDPVITDVHVGAGLRSDKWIKVEPDDLTVLECSNFFVARVTFNVTNYDPALPQRPSIPIEITRQVLVTRS